MSMLATCVYAAGAVAVGLYLVRRLRVRQWGHCDSSRQLPGRVVVITGANSGLGREAAYQLACRRATVVMACRDMTRASEAERYIRRRTSEGELIPMHLDLSDFASIQDFASKFRDRFSRLDVLMNNAGVAFPASEHRTTKQGFEAHFGVNYLGHYMLTGLLLDRLRTASSTAPDLKTAAGGAAAGVEEVRPARVVILASSLYKNGHVDVDHIADLGDALAASKPADGRRVGRLNPAYADSKLCSVLWGRRLAQLLADTGVHVHSCCPGWVYTGLFRHTRPGSWLKLVAVAPVAFLFMRTVAEGVQTPLMAAVDERLDSCSGLMYSSCRKTAYLPVADDAATGEALWQLSERLTGVVYKVTELERAQCED